MSGCRKSDLASERISRERTIDIFQYKRFVSSRDRRIHISPRTPPKSGKIAPLAPVGNHFIFIPYESFTFYLITVSLCRKRIRFSRTQLLAFIQSFGIGNRNFSILAATEQKGKIARCQLAIVKQEMHLAICRNRQ